MDFVGIVATEGRRVAELGKAGPLDARIPHMQRWTLTDVIAHLGGVHRWAADIVASRTFGGKGHRKGKDTGDALIAWFEDGVDTLVATLEGADPDDACGNFSPGSPNTVAFWRRRQAHETTMHRWDAEAAAGVHEPIEATFAGDGIDELFRTFTRSRGKQVLDGPIHIRSTDTDREWILAPTEKPGRVDLVDEPGSVVATLSGQAEPLLLALWKRISLDEADVAIEGDEQVVRGFVAGPVSP